ncbi:helix-turn-helix domain-containing protein [Clostridium sp. SYSU_GA19001]|uniref:helix-turn-helix domain-containing protein n=1 Tax=Clostridium caldaquaticum TaxID=2940653 RepID=UPI0020776909|nr:helix-turn-helix transcriptional regulator [Clostridium caldaquaticum]MCM8710492.1 helix-turn-helix domain-containing protein [Clostridium caldaquaticum]
METFGYRLRKLRTEKELTQSELGKLLNVTNVGVAKWESDDRFPDKETLIKIADYFNVSLDYLLCRTDNPKGILVNDNIDGNEIQIEVNKEVYPDGLTHEEVLEVLKTLKEQLGIDWEKFKKKNT